MKQDLLTFKNWSTDTVKGLINLAIDTKHHPQKYANALEGNALIAFFEKPSLRTRVSFDIGIQKLGGHMVYLDSQGGKLAGREDIQDMAANFGCWAQGIIARVNRHSTLETLASHTHVPVINALCDQYHPCQALADFITLKESIGELHGKTLAYVGDGNNVTHSLMIVAAHMGVNMIIATPEGRAPDKRLVDWAQDILATKGGHLTVTHNIHDVKHVDAIYTDTWISMGDDTPLEQIKSMFMPFQVNEALMSDSGASIVMHCQPAHRDLEITGTLIDSPASRIMQQAENRMHGQNAVLLHLLNNEFKELAHG
ncbi:ornithine carbamoyltransferase [Aestuariibacter sp. AA17]|uniref:Ornithine carbamoyltransferase n=1 Tax=Fluctibacter corallii TaxID=2984329 RepID=A0ABT3A6S0_9ALTE|nr:ornithine carbamoyltransferase [Aestuariibacter sp. AA17]MCV2884388.1 ornithine carbamoyltransferase [Aestuariibacter sp. AA17]